MYYVYMVLCADNTFYIGSSNNVEKRIVAHNSASKGAKYTRGRRPVVLVYKEEFHSKGLALSRECELKTFSKYQKKQLILDYKK